MTKSTISKSSTIKAPFSYILKYFALCKSTITHCTELAEAAKINQPMIARLESGDHRQEPTIETIHKFPSEVEFV